MRVPHQAMEVEHGEEGGEVAGADSTSGAPATTDANRTEIGVRRCEGGDAVSGSGGTEVGCHAFTHAMP